MPPLHKPRRRFRSTGTGASRAARIRRPAAPRRPQEVLPPVGRFPDPPPPAATRLPGARPSRCLPGLPPAGRARSRGREGRRPGRRARISRAARAERGGSGAWTVPPSPAVPRIFAAGHRTAPRSPSGPRRYGGNGCGRAPSLPLPSPRARGTDGDSGMGPARTGPRPPSGPGAAVPVRAPWLRLRCAGPRGRPAPPAPSPAVLSGITHPSVFGIKRSQALPKAGRPDARRRAPEARRRARRQA